MRVCAVVRTLNSASTLRRCLDSVRSQTVECDLVVVDSGSVDDTVEIVRSYGIDVMSLGEEYTPGRALNLGVANAGAADLCLLLSSHCWLPDNAFVERALKFFENPLVAGACGDLHDWRGRALSAACLVDHWPIGANVMWGFSNHASLIRVAAWRRTQFSESVDSCEDKAWQQSVHELGQVLLISPDLFVSSRHRREQGLRRLYQRARLEGLRCAQLGYPAFGAAIAYLRFQWRLRSPRYPRARVLRMIRPFNVVETLGVLRGIGAGQRPCVSGGGRPEGSSVGG